MNAWVKNIREKPEKENGFYEKNGFFNIIGCICEKK
jgi:hypothetical protein